ncbi:MAG: LysM peptidoglycan-binding domain-containing protein [Pseudomonadota bacterium]
MKICAFSKHIGLAALALAVAVGCSSSPTSQETEEPEVMEPKGMSKEAEEAIAYAKAVRYKVNSKGCEWDDTAGLIAQAEEEGNAGRNVLAISLANQAEERAVRALEDCEEEMVEQAPEPEPIVETGVTSYTVEAGDSLWGISAMDDIYGDPYQWPLIYRLNSDDIKDADLIYPGQVFAIDRTASSTQVEAAIAHAKNRGAWSVGVVEDSDRDYLGQ